MKAVSASFSPDTATDAIKDVHRLLRGIELSDRLAFASSESAALWHDTQIDITGPGPRRLRWSW
jgi:hypothetical protein